MYDKQYYRKRRKVTVESARRILELLWGYCQPASVLDVGCGTGTWLAECVRRGADEVLGIDGPWVSPDELEFPTERFIECDLGHRMPAGIPRHDLAMCIEVAEHLSADKGPELIELLASSADVVLFSAAVPGQGGTGHVNERLQSYWHHLFEISGFSCFDLIRPSIWEDEGINVIYKQNMLVYVRGESNAEQRCLDSAAGDTRISESFALDRIHPDLFVMRSVARRAGLRTRARRAFGRLLRDDRR